MKLTATLALCFACLVTTSQGFAATADKVYKWTDAKGQTHYAQRPPLGTKTEAIKPDISHSDPVSYAAPAAAEQAKADTKTGSTNALKDIDPERCDLARKNAEALASTARIRVKGDDGKYTYLSPEGRADKIAEFNEIIKESCK
jgi:Domain of unknown function (DUF4124)